MADRLAEPYTAPSQQCEAAMMGMYIFLASETMLFSGLFLVALYLRLEALIGLHKRRK
jgi:cytochrome c oxidase subunit 3